MSGPDLIVISMNLIAAVGLFGYCRYRDRGAGDSVVEAVVESISRAGAWSQPLNSYPMQSPARN